MASETVRVRGLDDTVRAFRRLESDVPKQIQKDLKTAVEPVRLESIRLISRFQGASIRTIRPRARGASAFVTQGARKVTGKRGDWGRRQQLLMEDALRDKQGAVMENVEGVLDKLIAKEF